MVIFIKIASMEWTPKGCVDKIRIWAARNSLLRWHWIRVTGSATRFLTVFLTDFFSPGRFGEPAEIPALQHMGTVDHTNRAGQLSGKTTREYGIRTRTSIAFRRRFLETLFGNETYIVGATLQNTRRLFARRAKMFCRCVTNPMRIFHFPFFLRAARKIVYTGKDFDAQEWSTFKT